MSIHLETLRAVQMGDRLPPDYYCPGVTIIDGNPVGSLWVEQPLDGEWIRLERESLGAEWVRVERWTEVLGMPWNPARKYRFRGKRLSGWPAEVQYYDEATKSWEDCPNINAHGRIARLTAALKEISESHDSPDNDRIAAEALNETV